MNKLIPLIPMILLLVLLASFQTGHAQIKALTEDGREVLLNIDGTWKYSKDSGSVGRNGGDSLRLNPATFTRNSGASFLVKSNTVNVGVYINPAKWTFTIHKDNEIVPEYRFSMKSGEGFAMLITEKTQIDLENMKEIALNNAQKAALDARIVSSEYRMVNGKKVLCLQIRGTIKGIHFTYLGYYYSNKNGTIQLLTYSSDKLFEESEKELETFLNGFTVLD